MSTLPSELFDTVAAVDSYLCSNIKVHVQLLMSSRCRYEDCKSTWHALDIFGPEILTNLVSKPDFT